jgi:hypothetical protein
MGVLSPKSAHAWPSLRPLINFEAQFKYPTKDDWTLQVKDDLEDFGMPVSLEFIRSKSIHSFRRLVKIKTKEYALKYLLNLKAEHSKLDNLMYSELKLQSYLKSDDIPVHEAKNLFRYRVRVADFKENFGNKYENKGCPLCTIHMDTQTHAVQCDKVKESISVEGNYNDIFKEKIPRNISKSLYKISKMRECLI